MTAQEHTARAAGELVKPHRYRPSWLHMGDCSVCGHVEDSPHHVDGNLCEDCPPVGYPTDKTRCGECPRALAEEGGK